MATIVTSTVSTATQVETKMSATQLDALMTGNSIYLEEPNGCGEIVLWYSADGTAMARLPSSSMLDGTWSIKGDASCIVWSYSPKDSCSVLVKRDGQMLLLEVGTNRLLGTVKRIVPGNSEEL